VSALRPALRAGLVGLLLVLGGVGFWARLLAGGPVLPGVPGGWVRGESVSPPPADWSFANGEPYLLVESRAWTLPYSARVWFLAHRGRLHLLLPGFFGDGLQRRLADDPRLRVVVEGRVYEQVAVRVTDDRDLAALVAPVLRRQFAVEVEEPVRALRGGAAPGVEMAVFRLDDPI
jgi:hypothetical protein